MIPDKIALEEHFILPSFGAYGADASALDGATKAHNYDPAYFADVQKRLGDATLRLDDMDHCGIERIVALALILSSKMDHAVVRISRQGKADGAITPATLSSPLVIDISILFPEKVS
jgi:hypothetical protein